MRENPPAKPEFDKIQRNILASNPRYIWAYFNKKLVRLFMTRQPNEINHEF